MFSCFISSERQSGWQRSASDFIGINEALCSFLASRKPEKFSLLHRNLGDLNKDSVIDEKDMAASRNSVELVFHLFYYGLSQGLRLEDGTFSSTLLLYPTRIIGKDERSKNID